MGATVQGGDGVVGEVDGKAAVHIAGAYAHGLAREGAANVVLVPLPTDPAFPLHAPDLEGSVVRQRWDGLREARGLGT